MVQKSGVIDGTIPPMPSPSKSQAPSKSSAKGKGKVAKALPQQERIDRLRAMMVLAQTPLLLITNPKDLYYLTGCAIEDSWLVVSAAECVVLSDFRFQEELEPLGRSGLARVIIRTGTIIEALTKVLAEVKANRLGLQGEHLTLARRQGLASALKNVRLIETTGFVPKLRLIKDDGEIKLLAKAVDIQEKALEQTLAECDKLIQKQGSFTESRFAAMLEYHMKLLGAEGPSFETIAGAGKNGSLPHYRAGAGVVKVGVPLLIDWGAVFGGYHGDMTRVVCWGKWPEKIKEVFTIVQDAHELAVEGLRAGTDCKVVDALARDHIAKAGYGEAFGHSLGHGIGLDIHEEPGLRKQAGGVLLKAGMVVTVEPGIYLPGVGGVRLENDYVVTEKGSKGLCRLKMDMKWSSR